MITTLAFSAFVAASLAWMGVRAIGDHRAALAQREGLLNEAATLLQGARIGLSSDRFPVLTGRLQDGRQAKVELIADTMVTRRLPQLWLRVTISEKTECARPTIGALARPTGAEYYSLVHDMPVWMTPPDTNASLLMRGDGSATSEQAAQAATIFRSLFTDPEVKEAVITPRGTRLIRQAAQGDRGSHMLLRQARFPLTAIPSGLVRQALTEAEALGTVLAEDEPVSPVYEAA